MKKNNVKISEEDKRTTAQITDEIYEDCFHRFKLAAPNWPKYDTRTLFNLLNAFYDNESFGRVINSALAKAFAIYILQKYSALGDIKGVVFDSDGQPIFYDDTDIRITDNDGNVSTPDWAREPIEEFKNGQKTPVDLIEKEIEIFFKDWKANIVGAVFNESGEKISIDDIKAVARYFATRARMYEEEYLKKDAIEGFIEGEQGSQEDEPHEVYAVSDSLDPEKYKIGDKVKVIVLKDND